jgi:hypothetical protein
MKNLTKLAAALSLALAAGNASAALTLPSVGDGLSQLLFSLEDNNAASTNFKHTFALDLSLGNPGLNYTSFLNDTFGSTTLTWDLSTVSQFANFAADTASLRWSVVGGNQRTTANAATTWGALATAHNGAADFPAVNGTNVVRTALTATGSIGAYEQSFINPALGAAQAANINPFTATTSTYETKLADLGGLQDSTGLHTLGAGSNDLWRATLATTGAGDLIQYSQLGTFTLSANNILSYSAFAPAPAAVPVPAAIWLFGSALLGMLGFTRRDNAKGLAA